MVVKAASFAQGSGYLKHDILSYVKLHFSYVKSNIECNWLNILRKYYVIMFAPKHSLLLRS